MVLVYAPGETRADLPVNWTMPATATSFHEVSMAMSQGQFRPYLQPVRAMGDARGIIGAEALIRWHHPVTGVLRASQFLSVVEEADLLVDLDVMTAGHLAADMALLGRAGRHLPRVWLNATVADIFSDRFVAAVGSAADRAGIGGGSLGVEVPQVLLTINEASVRRRLACLQNQGVAIAVDRFGVDMRIMGRRSTLDVIGIDPVLIECIDRDPAARRRVSALVIYAHGEGMSVIAKGVEEVGHLNVLEDLGCDGAQGYLLGEPVPASTLLGPARPGGFFDAA